MFDALPTLFNDILSTKSCHMNFVFPVDLSVYKLYLFRKSTGLQYKVSVFLWEIRNNFFYTLSISSWGIIMQCRKHVIQLHFVQMFWVPGWYALRTVLRPINSCQVKSPFWINEVTEILTTLFLHVLPLRTLSVPSFN